VARPGEPVSDRRVLKAEGSAQREVRIIRRDRDSDESIGLFHGTFGSSDIGTAFEQFRGKADRYARRFGVQRHGSQGELRSGLADEHGDGVLILRAKNSDIGVFRLRGGELSLRLQDGLLRVDAGFVQSLGEVDGLLEGLHGGVEEFFQSVLRAKLEVIDGEVGLHGEARVFEIGSTDLRGGGLGTHLVADAAPEVGNPGGVCREVVVDSSPAADFPGTRCAGIQRKLPRSGNAWRYAHGGEVRSPRLAHQSAGSEEAGLRRLNVLVRNIDLLLQGIQLGVIEDLPPLALEHGIVRVGGLPCRRGSTGRSLHCRRGALFVSRRHIDCRLVVLGSHDATGQAKRRQQREHRS